MRTAKRDRPETVNQAHTWDGNFQRYKRSGFCPRCASQAAWGHQIGWRQTGDVGDCCRGHALPVAVVGQGLAERWVSGWAGEEHP
jgi:hypothetical protein